MLGWIDGRPGGQEVSEKPCFFLCVLNLNALSLESSK